MINWNQFCYNLTTIFGGNINLIMTHLLCLTTTFGTETVYAILISNHYKYLFTVPIPDTEWRTQLSHAKFLRGCKVRNKRSMLRWSDPKLNHTTACKTWPGQLVPKPKLKLGKMGFKFNWTMTEVLGGCRFPLFLLFVCFPNMHLCPFISFLKEHLQPGSKKNKNKKNTSNPSLIIAVEFTWFFSHYATSGH